MIDEKQMVDKDAEKPEDEMPDDLIDGKRMVDEGAEKPEASDGRPYFHNPVTWQSVWEMPATMGRRRRAKELAAPS